MAVSPKPIALLSKRQSGPQCHHKFGDGDDTLFRQRDIAMALINVTLMNVSEPNTDARMI